MNGFRHYIVLYGLPYSVTAPIRRGGRWKRMSCCAVNGPRLSLPERWESWGVECIHAPLVADQRTRAEGVWNASGPADQRDAPGLDLDERRGQP